MQFSLSRVSKFITVLATLFVCLHSAAGPKEYEWDKLGYWSAEIGRLAVGTPSWKFQAFASPQLVCDDYVNLSRSLFSNTPKYDLKACPTTDAEIFVCRSPELECPDKATAFNDGGVDARPICYQQPLAENAQKGARGLSGYNFNTGKCNCNNFGGGANKTLFSTKDSPYCYSPAYLNLEANTTKYDRKEPDKKVRLKAYAEIPGTQPTVLIKKPDFKISVKTTSGQPGQLSNQTLDAAGVISFDYTFPSFSDAKTDTIVVTCEICADGFDMQTLDIPMAPTLVGFFNGVWNTEDQANSGLKELIKSTNAIKGKQNITYDLFYNQTGTGNPGDSRVGSALQDLAEVFNQRSRELDGVLANRWETFWDITGGSHASTTSSIGGMLKLLGSKAIDLAKLVDSIFNDTLGKVVDGFAGMLGNPPTAADLAAHNAKLLKYAEDGYPVVMIAHSQGNLFVNRAFDSLRAAKPGAPAKVVHVAPASPTLRGDYVLAGIDLVINGLRLQGITSVPLANISIPTSSSDVSGHKLVETYLDATRPALARVKTMIKSAIDSI